jgi:DNA-binding transcriptional LysR family regulator
VSQAQNLARRIALTTPHRLILPFAIAASDLVAAVPSRLAQNFVNICQVTIFELPVRTKPWLVSMLWSVLSEQDEAHRWLRHTMRQVGSTIKANSIKSN